MRGASQFAGAARPPNTVSFSGVRPLERDITGPTEIQCAANGLPTKGIRNVRTGKDTEETLAASAERPRNDQ
jgi:hypothetical protein